MNLEHTITRHREDDTEHDIEISVELTYYPAIRGARDSLMGVRGAGPPLEPDEPATFEITSVVNKNGGAEVSLTPEEEEEVINKAFESMD